MFHLCKNICIFVYIYIYTGVYIYIYRYSCTERDAYWRCVSAVSDHIVFVLFICARGVHVFARSNMHHLFVVDADIYICIEKTYVYLYTYTERERGGG